MRRLEITQKEVFSYYVKELPICSVKHRALEIELHEFWTPARDGEWSDLCLDCSPTPPPGAPVTICSRPGGFRSCTGYFGGERNLNYCLCRESNKSSGLYSCHCTDGAVLTLSRCCPIACSVTASSTIHVIVKLITVPDSYIPSPFVRQQACLKCSWVSGS